MIECKEEETTLINHLKSCKIENAWIGVHSQFVRNSWTTVQGKPIGKIGYVNWSKNAKADNYDGKNCATVCSDGMGNDCCSELKPFVCKIDLTC